MEEAITLSQLIALIEKALTPEQITETLLSKRALTEAQLALLERERGEQSLLAYAATDRLLLDTTAMVHITTLLTSGQAVSFFNAAVMSGHATQKQVRRALDPDDVLPPSEWPNFVETMRSARMLAGPVLYAAFAEHMAVIWSHHPE